MIDKKYALKYSYPHSVVHIVDNSEYQGVTTVDTAYDPSLFSTIVVTGSPIGTDNTIVTMTRSDVLGVAYGMRDVSKADIEKYGQSISYPMDLIRQNVPVKLLRVTPEDATYAYACILVEWRFDKVNDTMHVRFRDARSLNIKLDNVRMSAFKNVDKFNKMLVNAYKTDLETEEDPDVRDTMVDDGDDSIEWEHRRVFMTYISAGRGKEYNYFTPTIDTIQQGKRPANVAYVFSTIDTRTDEVVEEFRASLTNQNASDVANQIDPINTVVKTRAEGSSILIPTLNEGCLTELYNAYIAFYKDRLENTVQSDNYYHNLLKTLNINIFDPIYGRYIYNGDYDVYLPFYQVDMYDSSIPSLPETNRLYFDYDESTETKIPSILEDYIKKNTVGVYEKKGDRLGDIWLQKLGSGKNVSYVLNMVAVINQYSGNVTTVSASKLYVLNGTPSGNVVNKTERPIEIANVISIPNTEIDYSSTTSVGNQVKNYIAGDNTSAANIRQTYKGKIIAITYKITKSANTENVLIVYINNEGTVLHYSYKNLIKAMKFDREDQIRKNIIFLEESDQAGKSLTAKLGRLLLIQSNVEANPAIIGYNSNIELTGDNYGNYDYPAYYGTVSESIMTKEDIKNVDLDVITCGVDTIHRGINENSIKIVEHSGIGYAVDDKIFFTTKFGAEAENKTELFVKKVNTDGEVSAIGVSDRKKHSDNMNKLLAYLETNGVDGIVEVDGAPYIKKTVVEGEDPTYSIEGTAPAKPTDETSETYEADLAAWTASMANYQSVFSSTSARGTGLKLDVSKAFYVIDYGNAVQSIVRYSVMGTAGSLYDVQEEDIEIPSNYYSEGYGLNPSSEYADIKMAGGSTGFFDQYPESIDEIEFKWRYSELLVKAFRGQIDPRIMSPTRCPAKFLFDGGTNTVYGQTLLPYKHYPPLQILRASSIFTEEEIEQVEFGNSTFNDNISENEGTDVDVKQAMYDLMEYRCYQGIPEDKRPIGPGSGLQLHLDSGYTDANTTIVLNKSFTKRFTNPNASWDIGGFVDARTGAAFTYTKKLVQSMFAHMQEYTINKPFVGKYTAITNNQYISFFPDVDTTDWELRELIYNSGGNAWVMDANGNLTRRSQRTMKTDSATSDLLQENNMRTLSRLVYLLQTKIDTYLLEYNDDSVLRSLSDECNILFSGWIGTLVESLSITFERDTNIDGGDIVVCYVNVTFRGLILRVPIIVNVNRRIS